MNSKINILDVREDFRTGNSPCDKIKNALNAVPEGGALRLLVSFEPVPLFDVAAQLGFGHKSNPCPDGHWQVLFDRNLSPLPVETPVKTGEVNCSITIPGKTIELDVRGLEPPQPMVRILETLGSLPEGVNLNARTDRRPVHLYAQLEHRGFIGESEEQEDATFITHIRRA